MLVNAVESNRLADPLDPTLEPAKLCSTADALPAGPGVCSSAREATAVAFVSRQMYARYLDPYSWQASSLTTPSAFGKTGPMMDPDRLQATLSSLPTLR